MVQQKSRSLFFWGKSIAFAQNTSSHSTVLQPTMNLQLASMSIGRNKFETVYKSLHILMRYKHLR